MTELTTRKAKLSDIPRLVEIEYEQQQIQLQLDQRLQSLWHYQAKQDLEDDFDDILYEMKIAGIGNAVEREVPDWIFVAERDSKILGFTWFSMSSSAKTAEIAFLAIDPHDGQGGVGTALLNRCMEILREHNIKNVTVTVPKHHAVQQAFWRAKGASVIQETFYLSLRDRDDE